MSMQAEEDHSVAQMRQLKGTGGEQAFQARLQASLHGIHQVVARCLTAAVMAWAATFSYT